MSDDGHGFAAAAGCVCAVAGGGFGLVDALGDWWVVYVS